MKKVLALLLAISMVFIFTACGGETTDEDPDDDSQAIEEMKMEMKFYRSETYTVKA